ncbi:MAG: excinuclease ABC subunit UvrB, partial [Rhizobiales bacterium]|nr:excinuclease ABC subunit UvrB [Hyphomicrobiales bacterium]
MAKAPDKPTKPKDPVERGAAEQKRIKPTRAKAHRPDAPPADPALDALLNPGIAKGTAGIGSGTGLQPPPDNSFDRRAAIRDQHTARASTPQGFKEKPQTGYVARDPFTGPSVTGLDPALAKELGLDGDDSSPP